MPPTSLYVHIPFCASRCYYCDFTTYVAPESAMVQYVDDLKREFVQLQKEAVEPIETVFFGGGTPTLLSDPLLREVLTALQETFALAPTAEITMEANPGTVTPSKLAMLRKYGVNRLSFGAQTFSERLLMAVGRIHDAEAIINSVLQAQAAGFEHLNVDLMFGLPEQTLEDVKTSLDHVLELSIDHVSAYWLKIESGTPFAAWQAQGALTLPGEDAEGDMYDLVRKRLVEEDFTHYEVSNFARSGGQSRHNLVYWHNEPYLAAGAGAHGYLAGQRYENVRSLAAYHDAIRRSVRPVQASRQVTAAEAMEDTMMLGLRLAEGVSRARFLELHNVSMTEVFGDVIENLQRKKLLQWKEDALCLTAVAWPIGNLVFEEFVAVLKTD